MTRYLAAATLRGGADPLVHAVEEGRELRKRVEAVCGAHTPRLVGTFEASARRACVTCASVTRYVDEGCPDSIYSRREPVPAKPSKWWCFVCDEDLLTAEGLERHEVVVHDEEPVSA